MNAAELVAKLTPDEISMLSQIAKRAWLIAQEIKRQRSRQDVVVPDYHAIMMDYAILHADRGLRLFGLLLADDRTFFEAFVKLQIFIDRENMSFPNEARIGFEVNA